MVYKHNYRTPAGFSDMIMTGDGEYLTGLWFDRSKDTQKHDTECEEKDLEIFRLTREWLDVYFSGGVPDFTPEYRLENVTPFRQEVVDIMNNISYGEVITYKDIADQIAEKRNMAKMSAQAVGGAVGWNPICIIIPCHRVVGSNHSLTGYGGGINNKLHLLELEGINTADYSVPTKGTALQRPGQKI